MPENTLFRLASEDANILVSSAYEVHNCGTPFSEKEQSLNLESSHPYIPHNNKQKITGLAGHPCLIPRLVYQRKSSSPTTATSPYSIAFQIMRQKGLSVKPICRSMSHRRPLCTESYALSMSNARLYNLPFYSFASSIVCSIVNNAVEQLRYGQKPC